MARAVKPWIGRTDDSRPPKSVQLRILDRQQNLCAITGQPFDAKHKPQFDHKTPLWLGGANSEENLQAIRSDPHKAKTAAEAKVRGKVMAAAAKHVLPSAPAKPIQSRGFPKPAKEQKPAKFDMTIRRSLFTGDRT
jgi:5-methylcytosine-specific restriction protein A